jgi:hypothetical protein
VPSVLHYILIGVCVLVAIVGMFVGVLFCAFADSPDGNRAVRRALPVAFVWTIIALAFSRHCVLHPAAWWSCGLAVLAAASPPAVLIGFTFLMMRWTKR